MSVMGQVIDGRQWVLWDDVKEAVEAHRTKSESGTTGCSDAGGGDTPSKPGRSADWQAMPTEEVRAWINKWFDALESVPENKWDADASATIEDLRSMSYSLERIEERRRSEERT